MMPPNPLSEDYPHPLAAAEIAAIRARRERSGGEPDAPVVGVALSGGGIRSATFCVGLFQALARQNLVRRIDFLSTVSGGGYFGSFLGASFSREGASADSIERELANNHSWSINWLRENGRFLSPNGLGDNWLTGAIALRNWVALHLVLLTFGFLILGLSALVRSDLSTAVVTRPTWTAVEQFFWDHKVAGVWWSPWLLLPAIPFATIMVTTGTLYWLTQFTALMGLLRRAGGAARQQFRVITTAEFTSRAQLLLTRGFLVGLVSTVVMLGFALADSLGQTAYWKWSAANFDFPSLWAFLTAAGAGLYGLAARIVPYIESLLGTRKLRITFSVVALGLAFLWLALIVLGLAVIACGFGWDWKAVATDGQFHSISGGWRLTVVVTICFALSWIFSRSFGFVNLSSMQQMYAARLSRAYLGASNPARQRHANHSMTDLIPGDDLPLDSYAPQRNGGPLHLINVTVNETISGKTHIERRDRKGLAMAVGPCGLSVGTDTHALWVACDETDPACNETQQALWEHRQRLVIPIDTTGTQTFHPFATGYRAAPGSTAGLTLPKRIEALAVGRWVAISGAAFTTGSGANTHLGLSLLLGLANVRLGYWWDSGATPRRSGPVAPPNFLEMCSRLLTRLLPVQTCLMNEFFARFHGPGRRHWYLSDGGHFENTGCYELIRRRVPFIICSDAGQDDAYRFDDLANLIRKARTDFGAEIQIVYRRSARLKDDPGELHPMPALEDIVHPELLDVLGSPEDFALPASADPARTDDEGPSSLPLARAHALLARIHYADTDEFGWMLVVKPSLMGDEVLDVVQYRATHPLFPQEPTSDQYFDEAQWESYRKLGEHIGAELFTPPVKPGPGWSPSQFRPPAVTSAGPTAAETGSAETRAGVSRRI